MDFRFDKRRMLITTEHFDDSQKEEQREKNQFL